MSFRADLHCHSLYSDGTDTPEQLILLAKAEGLSGLSITDHDTIAAYPEAMACAAALHIDLLPGVEFSAYHQGEAVHILGYAFSLASGAIAALCERHRLRRIQRNRNMLVKLQQLGIFLDEGELSRSQGTVGRPHIAQLMVKKGVVASVQEAFLRYLGEGRAAYDPGAPLSVEETLAAIHQAKGKAILAHPHLLSREELVKDFFDMPFDGIEGYYARFSPEKNSFWVRLAQRKGWIVTGGSDYHGKMKPHYALGSAWVDQETFEHLHHLSKINS